MKIVWQCPHCDFRTENVYDLDVAVQHAWEEHDTYCRFEVNGEVIEPTIHNPITKFIASVLS